MTNEREPMPEPTPEFSEPADASPEPVDASREPADGSPEPADASREPADGSREPGAAAPDAVTEHIRQALRGVRDPELGINIVDLGLVYGVEVEEGNARITMTLTSPGCPAGGQILTGARAAAESVEGVESAEVELVWKPFWTPERIDPKVRAMMGF